MNATETKKIMEAKMEADRQKRIKKHEQYIEYEIAPNVKASAELGYSYCTLTRNYAITYDYIVERLTELGYKVELDNNNIRISW